MNRFVMAITHGPKLATREDAMAAFAKSWRREILKESPGACRGL
jgi:hypothetical protein